MNKLVALLFLTYISAFSKTHVFWYTAATNAYDITYTDGSGHGPSLPSGTVLHEGKIVTCNNSSGLGYAGTGFSCGSSANDDQGWNCAFFSADLHTMSESNVTSAKIRAEYDDWAAANGPICNGGSIAIRAGVANISFGISMWGGPASLPDDAVWADLDPMSTLNYTMSLSGAEETINYTTKQGRISNDTPPLLDSQFIEIDVTDQVNWILSHKSGNTYYAIVLLSPIGAGSTGKFTALAAENRVCYDQSGLTIQNSHWSTDCNTAHLVVEVTIEPPVITSIVPDSGDKGGSYSAIIYGSSFSSGMQVFFGSTQSSSVTYNSSTQLMVIVPSSPGNAIVDIVAKKDTLVDTLINGFSYYTDEPPEITNILTLTDTVIPENIPYTLDIDATDPNSDIITYSLPIKPYSMSINTSSGLILWTPNSSYVGRNTVRAIASDNHGMYDTLDFAIHVTDINDTPVISSTSPVNAYAERAYTYTIIVTDPDAGDLQTFSLLTQPSGMTITGNVISWTPQVSQVGDTTVSIRVHDLAGASDTQTYTLHVREISGDGYFSIDANTIALWQFNENGGDTAFDISGNNNHARIYNALPVSSLYGYALDFNGTNAYATALHSTSLASPATQLTIEAIVWIDAATNQWCHILDKTSAYAASLSYGKPASFLQDIGGWWTPSVSPAPTGQWVQMAIQYNGSNQRIYIDSVLVSERWILGTINETNNRNLLIGAGVSGSTPAYWFNGKIDEIRVSNCARYNTIQDTAYFSLDTNTIALWRFNEGSGATVLDASGKGYTGTIQNSMDWSAGKYGNALFGNANNEYVSIPRLVELETAEYFKIEAMVNIPTYNASIANCIFYLGQVQNPDSLVISLSVGGSSKALGFETAGLYAAGTGKILSAAIPDSFFGKWNEVGVEYYNGIRKLLLNHQVIKQDTVVSITKFPGTYLIRIGDDTRSVSSWYLNGYVDEVKVTAYNPQANHAPIFVSQPDTVTLEDSLYLYHASATDPDLDTVSLSLQTAPVGMTLSGDTILWIPMDAGVGSHTVIIRASDGKGGITNQTYTLRVVNTPDPPVFTSCVPTTDTSLAEGDSLVFRARAIDPDNAETVGYFWFYNDTYMSNESTYTLRPNFSAFGPCSVRVVAFDGNGQTIHSWNINVTNTGIPPAIIAPMKNTAITGDSTIAWGLSADPDLDSASVRYRVEFSTTSAFSSLLAYADSLTSRSYKVHDLVVAGTFPEMTVIFMRVVAYDTMGYSTGFSANQHSCMFLYYTNIENAPVLPKTFVLYQNSPNPFNPSTGIRFGVPALENKKQWMRMQIFDIKGCIVRTLIDGEALPGYHAVVWDSRDDQEKICQNGVYILKMACGPYNKSIKMALIK